jgi:hypothetical protein
MKVFGWEEITTRFGFVLVVEFVNDSMEWDGTVGENEPEETVIAVCSARFALLDLRQGVTLEPMVVPPRT